MQGIIQQVKYNKGSESQAEEGYRTFKMYVHDVIIKYGITDMRGFFDNDLRWLNHYGFNPFDLTSSSGI